MSWKPGRKRRGYPRAYWERKNDSRSPKRFFPQHRAGWSWQRYEDLVPPRWRPDAPNIPLRVRLHLFHPDERLSACGTAWAERAGTRHPEDRRARDEKPCYFCVAMHRRKQVALVGEELVPMPWPPTPGKSRKRKPWEEPKKRRPVRQKE